ncbi:MAG: cell division protein FtsZ [Anaerolineales bacterium]|nr:cell division protein FtsZ [Anaerolineales bacterium]
MNLSMPVTHELKPKITVVGVGGAGGNAVNNMITSHLEGVEFVACNTDAQALANCLTERKIQLGHTITHGLGAGARPEVGSASAEEALDEILDQLQGSNMVFITAGMGGGTGTGAAPVIARAVREQGILTVGVVTKPFHFEGAHRMRLAEGGLAELQEYVDTLIVIPNDRLLELTDKRMSLVESFGMADDVLRQGIQGISELITVPGLINLDFADVRTIMAEGGAALMAVGRGEGEDKARQAANQALSSRLLDVTIDGARGILFNVTGGPNMSLFEVNEAAAIIRETAHPDANMIFGAVIDESMGDEMRVTVIATGFERDNGSRRQVLQRQYGHPHDAVRRAEPRRSEAAPTPPPAAPEPAPQPVDAQLPERDRRARFSPDNLEIPAFLRRR